MHAPDMPDAVMDAALAAYAQKRWRTTDIAHPATAMLLDNEVRDEAFNAALAVAYRSGIEAALKRVEWRVSYRSAVSGERVVWSNCATEETARRDQLLAASEGRWDEPWVESRRAGETDWERPVQP